MATAPTASTPASGTPERLFQYGWGFALTQTLATAVDIDLFSKIAAGHRTVDALVKAHRRFATGVYAVWYPVIERRWVERFERALRATGIAPMDVYELCGEPTERFATTELVTIRVGRGGCCAGAGSPVQGHGPRERLLPVVHP